MKPSTPNSSAATPASTLSSYRPPGAAPAPAGRATTASDFRANIERQSREQKSVGGVLAIVVYVLIGFFVLSAGFAIYGGYTLSRQIHQQSVTVSDLDARYAAANQTLTQNLAVASDALIQAQGQIRRQQDMLLRQQDTINKLVVTNDAIVTALRQEKMARTSETTNLRARVRALELQVPPRAGQ